MTSLMARSALVDYFVKGGPWMWALLACSVIGLAVIIYKAVGLWLAGRGADGLVAEVMGLVEAGEDDAALRRCQGSEVAVGAVLAAVLAAAGTGHESPRDAAVEAGAAQVAELESGLPVLGTIANISPLIGFLGTVSGMIRAFTAIAEHGLGEPGVVASGIGEALITTAGGLIVAIPCYIAYSYLVARVNRMALTLELAGSRLANLLVGRQRNAA